MQLKIGNPKVFRIPITDSAGDPVTNLATADDILYMIKKNQTDDNDDALITKKVSTGGIEVDTPIEGIIEITINSPDSVDVGFIPNTNYYHAVKIDYPGDDTDPEIKLVDGSGRTVETIYIKQNTID